MVYLILWNFDISQIAYDLIARFLILIALKSI